MSKCVVSFARGEHFSRCAEITWPRWKDWAARFGHDAILAQTPNRLVCGHAAKMMQKLIIMMQLLQTYDRVLWADIDAMPNLDAPDFLIEEECEGEVLGIPIDEPCPHAIEFRAGLFRVTGDAGKNLLGKAIDVMQTTNCGGFEEQAIAVAAGLEARGTRAARPEPFTLPKGINRLPKSWLSPADGRFPDAPGLHAYIAAPWKAQQLALVASEIEMRATNRVGKKPAKNRRTARKPVGIGGPIDLAAPGVNSQQHGAES